MKKLFLLILILILMVPGVCGAATLWQKVIGNVVYYDTGASSCADVTAADTSGTLSEGLTAAGARGTVNWCAGTYTGDKLGGAASGVDTAGVNQTINIVGTVILDGQTINDHAMRMAHTGWILNDPSRQLTIYPSTTGNNYGFRVETTSTGYTMAYAPTIDGLTTGQRGAYLGAPGSYPYLTIKNTANTYGLLTAGAVVLPYLTYTGNAGRIGPSANLTIYGHSIKNNTILQAAGALIEPASGYTLSVYDGEYSGNGSYIEGTGTATIWATNNNVFDNTAEFYKARTGTPTAYIYNNSFMANAAASKYAIVHNAVGAGAPTYFDYNQVLPPVYGLLGVVPSVVLDSSGTVTDGGHNVRKPAGYAVANRPAIVIFGSDDATNITNYYQAIMAPKLEAYGWRGTMALNVLQMNDARWTSAKALDVAGHDIAAHGFYASASVTDASGITLAHATGKYSISGNTLTLEDAGGSPTATINLDQSYDGVVHDVSGNGWSATRNNSNDTIYGRGAWLADHSHTAAGIVLNDMAKVYATEVIVSKSAIEASLNHTISSWVCPGNNTNAALQAQLLAAGYTGARGTAGVAGSYLMSSINTYGVMTKNLYDVYGGTATPTDASAQEMLGGILETIKYKGGVAYLYAHTTADLSAAGWDSTLAVVYASGVQVMTLAQAVAYLKANGTDSGDHMTYTRTMTDASDFSPAAGASICTTGYYWTGFTGNLRYDQVTYAGAKQGGCFLPTEYRGF